MTIINLSSAHRAQLAASGISDAAIIARGYRTVTDPEELRDTYGITEAYQRRVPTLLVPLHTVTGAVAYYTHRPDDPRVTKGRARKYEVPAGKPARLDVPPAAQAHLRDVDRSIVVTEGAKKADAAVSVGMTCVSLPGVWMWRSAEVQADFDAIAWRDRIVRIAFDSDAYTKPSVAQAVIGLARFLKTRGSKIIVVQLPELPGGKCGLDDYLVAGHTAEDFYRLPSMRVPMPWLDLNTALAAFDVGIREVVEDPSDQAPVFDEAFLLCAATVAKKDRAAYEMGRSRIKTVGVRVAVWDREVKTRAGTVSKQRRKSSRRRVGDKSGSANPAGPPEIDAGDRLRDTIPRVWAAVLEQNKKAPVLFRSGIGRGVFVRLQISPEEDAPPELKVVTKDMAFGFAFRIAAWYRERTTADGDVTRIPADPRKEVGADMVANPSRDLPKLDDLVLTPVVDRMGRLITKPGYHAESRIYYHQGSELRGLSIPDNPTAEDVAEAREALRFVFSDFPFSSPADETHALGALFLPFIRQTIRGCTPLHMFEAPTAGTGKSLIVDLIHRVVTGMGSPAGALPKHSDELRKKITSLLVAKPSMICFDNAERVNLGELAGAVTADPWTDRILGASRVEKLPNRAVWTITANNPELTKEIARRCVRVRVDAHVENPEFRSGFRIDNIRGWVIDYRARIVSAVLTIVSGWVQAGMPRFSGKDLGSFESWTRRVGGLCEFAGLEGFLENRGSLMESTEDYETEIWRAFLTNWWRLFREEPKAASDLMPVWSTFAEPEGGGPQPHSVSNPIALGIQLRKREGTVLSGFRIERAGKRGNANRYTLRHFEGQNPTTSPRPPSDSIPITTNYFRTSLVEKGSSIGNREVGSSDSGKGSVSVFAHQPIGCRGEITPPPPLDPSGEGEDPSSVGYVGDEDVLFDFGANVGGES